MATSPVHARRNFTPFAVFGFLAVFVASPCIRLIAGRAEDGPTFRQETWMTELVFRYFIGGLVVSLFAALGDVLKPKSFAGLFGAAPSVALATLNLTILSEGKDYAAMEARSMIAGAAAFFVYASVCTRVLAKRSLRALKVTSAALVVWFVVAISAWLIFLN